MTKEGGERGEGGGGAINNALWIVIYACIYHTAT